MESAVRKKKQILLAGAELEQQRARGVTPEKPSLFGRVAGALGHGGKGGAHALEQSIATLREEVC